MLEWRAHDRVRLVEVGVVLVGAAAPAGRDVETQLVNEVLGVFLMLVHEAGNRALPLHGLLLLLRRQRQRRVARRLVDGLDRLFCCRRLDWRVDLLLSQFPSVDTSALRLSPHVKDRSPIILKAIARL